MSKNEYNKLVLKAAIEQDERLKGNREPNVYKTPDGIFFLKRAEYQKCCDKIKKPNKYYKERLKTHACTYQHVAYLYNVDPKDLRRAVKEYRKTLELLNKAA